jgi:hypothetical protein
MSALEHEHKHTHSVIRHRHEVDDENPEHNHMADLDEIEVLPLDSEDVTLHDINGDEVGTFAGGTVNALRARTIEQMRMLKADEFVFEIERMSHDGLYFSAEALQSTSGQILSFLGARVLAWGDQQGVAPAKVKVTVKVECER